MGFFERIRKKYGHEHEEHEEAVTKESAEETVEELHQPLMPDGRGVLHISEQSLLYTLWREYTPAWASLYDGMYVVMEKPDEEPVPIDTASLESEKQRMGVKLMMEAKKRHRLVHPKEEKPKRKEGEEEPAIELPPPIPDLDADAVTYISKGAMGAWIMLFPPSGEGEPMGYEELMEALEAESIVYGVDEKRIEELARNPVYFELVLIARGLPAIPGEDGWVEEKYPRELQNTFGVDAFGNVDYHSRVNMQVVKEDDVLCEAFPPTQGVAGMKITGTEIPAKDGKPPKLLGGVNTKFNEEKNKLLAAMEGNLLYRNERFCVQPLFQVMGDVDYSIGNIDFPGDVHVMGDVKNGFVVRAKGHIVIDGLVEGAILEAGGNISIRKGVLGDDRAVIRSQQSVSAQYLENCIVYAGDKVETSSVITSSIYSDNAIVVRSGRGTIIGGKLIATNMISATVIGCRSERLTELVIGEYPMLKQQKDELMTNLKEVLREEETTDRNIRYLDVEGLVEDESRARERASVLAKLRLQKSVLGMRKERLQKQLEELEHKEVDLSKCKVICDTIYPVTKVHCGERWYTVDQLMYRCNIHIKDDELTIY